MTMKNSCRPSREWQTKTSWQRSPVDDGGHSSQDKWRKPARQATWKEVSHTVEEMEMMSKDKKITWVESCQEGSKRESEVLVMAEESASMEKLTNTPGP